MKEARRGLRALPLAVLVGWVGGEVGGVLVAGVGFAAFGGELAAGVLPAFAGIVPVEAHLGEISADALDRGLGETNPNPLSNYFGKFELLRHPALEFFENLFNAEGAVKFALGKIHIGLYGHALGCGFGFRFRCGFRLVSEVVAV